MNTKYIGVKVINATPMTRAEYNTYRGWQLPADENGNDHGFLVEYLDGGKANMPDRAGYVSWSPADVFQRAYRQCSGLTFGLAIEALKAGQRVARAGWNSKGMWLEHVKAREVQLHKGNFCPRNEHDHDWRSRVPALLPWIGMKTADNKFVPWLASQTDMLAEDWVTLE